MTDREMLEYAAKGAGYEILKMGDGTYVHINTGGHDKTDWNPLTDDGDALRLAAKLKIDLEWQSTGPFPDPLVEAYQRNKEEGSYFCASEHEDDYRLAIVRAAAEIGKEMP